MYSYIIIIIRNITEAATEAKIKVAACLLKLLMKYRFITSRQELSDCYIRVYSMTSLSLCSSPPVPHFTTTVLILFSQGMTPGRQLQSMK